MHLRGERLEASVRAAIQHSHYQSPDLVLRRHGPFRERGGGGGQVKPS